MFAAELAAGAHHLAAFGAAAFDEDAFFDEPIYELFDLAFGGCGPRAVAAGVVGDEVEDGSEAEFGSGFCC